jgi:hypothetical protein
VRQFLILASFAFGVAALRGRRFAYGVFVAAGLLYFPARVAFHLSPRACEIAFDLPMALHSLTNYPHIVLFALFFVMSRAQFHEDTRTTFLWAALMTLVMGALVEAAEGITGRGNCRFRDFVPDSAGALIGAGSVYSWIKFKTLLLDRRERFIHEDREGVTDG